MKRSLILGALVLACGGSVGEAPVDAPDGGGAPERVEIPNCPGEREPEQDDCQTLVYDLATGYCNRWEPCR
jgi:hypothetical protein